MSKIIAIGIGNPLRGDDGIGWLAIDQLAEFTRYKEVEFIKCRELAPELSEKISKSEYVLFIDADIMLESGEVQEKRILPAQDFPTLETHQLDPAGILSFSSALYGKIPDAIMLTIRGRSFEFEENISEEARQGVQALLVRAREILDEWSKKLQIETCNC